MEDNGVWQGLTKRGVTQDLLVLMVEHLCSVHPRGRMCVILYLVHFLPASWHTLRPFSCGPVGETEWGRLRPAKSQEVHLKSQAPKHGDNKAHTLMELRAKKSKRELQLQ